ncbi:hypothetical protein EON78_02245, partial [bacterium]
MDKLSRHFISVLSKGKYEIGNTVQFIKSNAEYKHICELTDNQSVVIQNNLAWFIGNPFPKSYQDLGKVPMVIESDELIHELNWLFLGFRKGYDKLRDFIPLKDSFEKSIFLGDYELAENLLDQIETKISFSLWTLENRLLLAELKGGLEGNKELLQNLLSTGLYTDVEFLSIYLSERVEMNSGVSDYFQKMLSAFNDYENFDKEHLISFFTFRLDPYESDREIDAKAILEISFKFSLVDRYLIFLKLLSQKVGNRIDFPIDKFIYKLKGLHSRISDPILENLVRVYDIDLPVNYETENAQLLEMHENYLKGNHEAVVQKGKAFLKENPTSLSALQFFVKSNFFVDLEILLDSSTIFSRLLRATKIAYSKAKDSQIEVALFFKLAYVLESFNIGFQLYSFGASEIMNDYSSRVPDSMVEVKEYAIAWHYRLSPQRFASYQAYKLKDELERGSANLPVTVIKGNKVIEARAVEANKGYFVNWLLQNNYFGYKVVAIGDDTTDEEMFASVHNRGISIKVGNESLNS